MEETDSMNVEDTSPDVLGYDLKPSNSSQSDEQHDNAIIFDPTSWQYDMSGDKYLIIFNHHTFQRTEAYNYEELPTRTGTDNDVTALTTLFEGLGFKVEPHRNLVYTDVMTTLTNVAKRNHTRTSCICITILTHGHKKGLLCAADRPYWLSDVLTKFENRPDLVNKPKLFFIQACRGDKVDDGVDGTSDATVPTHADFLILRSTVEDYRSYRNDAGSWMVQALCPIITNYHKELDLLQMITLMNRKVAQKHTRNRRNEEMRNKKQMPETTFTLTKQLKF